MSKSSQNNNFEAKKGVVEVFFPLHPQITVMCERYLPKWLSKLVKPNEESTTGNSNNNNDGAHVQNLFQIAHELHHKNHLNLYEKMEREKIRSQILFFTGIIIIWSMGAITSGSMEHEAFSTCPYRLCLCVLLYCKIYICISWKRPEYSISKYWLWLVMLLTGMDHLKKKK